MRVVLACVLALTGSFVHPASADVISATQVVAGAHQVQVGSMTADVLLPTALNVVQPIIPEDVQQLVAAAQALVRAQLDELSRLLGLCLPTASLLGGGCFQARESLALRASNRGTGSDTARVAVAGLEATAAPEPASIALTATALAAAAASRRRRRRPL